MTYIDGRQEREGQNKRRRHRKRATLVVSDAAIEAGRRLLLWSLELLQSMYHHRRRRFLLAEREAMRLPRRSTLGGRSSFLLTGRLGKGHICMDQSLLTASEHWKDEVTCGLLLGCIAWACTKHHSACTLHLPIAGVELESPIDPAISGSVISLLTAINEI
jgi:hypothetical protein